MPKKKKNARIRAKKHLTLPNKNYAKNECTNSSQKKHLTIPYKNYAIKNVQIRTKKETNTPLQKLCQKKKSHTFEPTKAPNTTLKKTMPKKRKIMHKFELKKHLTLSYKNYNKKKRNCSYSIKKKHVTLA